MKALKSEMTAGMFVPPIGNVTITPKASAAAKYRPMSLKPAGERRRAQQIGEHQHIEFHGLSIGLLPTSQCSLTRHHRQCRIRVYCSAGREPFQL